MIKRSLWVFACLFILYSVFIILTNKKLDTVQYQYQQNIIQADKYIYNNEAPRNVIIGSSLSARIITDSIPATYNLAMPGLGIMEGCDILLKRNRLPNKVFIETNILFRQPSEDFLKSFDSPVDAFFKYHFKALRDQNQPVGVLKGIIKATYNSSYAIKAYPILSKSMFDELLTSQYKFYQHTDSVAIKKTLAGLKKEISTIAARGSKVYFFEMPVNSKLEETPLAKFSRQVIKETFPEIEFIGIPDDRFTTVDGIHLGPQEAIRYTGYFKSQLNKL